MKHIIPVLAVFCIVLLVLLSGCANNISADTVKGKHFGNTFDTSAADLAVQTCFVNLYGDLRAKGDPRFIEPLITTGLDQNNLPINNVVKFPANQDSIYFFVIYDNFKDGDDVTVTWMYSSGTSREVAKVVNKTADDYGRFIITFQKPDGGWNEGTNMIQVTSTYGTQKTIVFEVGGNTVETQKLTCSDSTAGSASQASGSTGTSTSTSCRPSCTLGTKCNDEQDCASGFCVQGVCSAAPVSQAATSTCPGIWGGTWDTKWMSYQNKQRIVDLASGVDDWNGVDAPLPTKVTLTQNNCDVTGKIEFPDPVCIGTFTTTIDKNNPNQLKGQWKTTGCEAEPGDETYGDGHTGDFSWTMAGDDKSWLGTMISGNNYYKTQDYPDNWAGRREASSAGTSIVKSDLTYRPTLNPTKVVIDTRFTTPTTIVTTTTTSSCPASIWGGTWDTRWNSYENGETIIDLASGKDDWNGNDVPPSANPTLTQNCWDVTGTIVFATDPVCTGTITGTIDKNSPNHLTGVWKTGGCQPEDYGANGIFSVTMMTNDNKIWIGKLISENDPFADRDYPSNWVGKR